MNFLGENKKKYTVLNSIITLLSDRQAFFLILYSFCYKKILTLKGQQKSFVMSLRQYYITIDI